MNKEATFNNLKYGQLVEVRTNPQHGWESGYHTGMKVHFFNQKGVLVGNIYKFIPYDQIRHRKSGHSNYPRVFMGQRGENIKQWVYERLCSLMTFLIRYTQSINYKKRAI